MKQNKIFIEVCEGNTFYKVEISKATQSERFDYYNKISKGQVIKMLEQFNFNKNSGGKI